MARDAALERVLMVRNAVTRIAKAAGVSTAAVSQWRKVPAWHVETVSRVTGVPPHELRPDLHKPPPASPTVGCDAGTITKRAA